MEDIQKIIPAKNISWSNYPFCSFDNFSKNLDIISSGNDEREREEGENEEEHSEEEYEEEHSEEEYEEEEYEEEGRCIEIIDIEEDDAIIVSK